MRRRLLVAWWRRLRFLRVDPDAAIAIRLIHLERRVLVLEEALRAQVVAKTRQPRRSSR